jgi:hypothetical protein
MAIIVACMLALADASPLIVSDASLALNNLEPFQLSIAHFGFVLILIWKGSNQPLHF